MFSIAPKLKNLRTNGKLREYLFKLVAFTIHGSYFVSTAYIFSCYDNSSSCQSKSEFFFTLPRDMWES